MSHGYIREHMTVLCGIYFIAIVTSHAMDVSKNYKPLCAGTVTLLNLICSMIIALLLGRDEKAELEDYSHGNA